jgi:dihydrofolate reductase
MILISAMTRDRVIGSADGLPWSIPDEYQHFLGLVRGQAVIFGRKSYEIFGPDLPDSELFVISRAAAALEGAHVCSSVEEAAERARQTGRRVFSAGGASIYRLTMPMADAMYLSIIKGDYSGDTRFPEFDEKDWLVTRRDDHPEFEFRVYERRPDGS